jgi:succinate dehydrogenase flavin-adding protein (antitoxin of CptAB toxin-antitoxin module)
MIENLFIQKTERELNLLVQCCECRGFKHKDNTFHKYAEDSVKKLELTYFISHTLCIPCMDKQIQELKNLSEIY